MPTIIPMTADGARRVTVEVAGKRITFRTYYSVGQSPVWLLDLFDTDGTPLITGIALWPGSDNVLKGHGDTLNGYQLFVFATDDNPSSPNALGQSVTLWMYEPGEENLFSPGDPLLYIQKTILS